MADVAVSKTASERSASSTLASGTKCPYGEIAYHKGLLNLRFPVGVWIGVP